MTPAKRLLSIVVPVFNEAENVRPLYERVTAAMTGLADRYEYEILFTDNRSTDDTFARIVELVREDRRVRVIRLSRNFGYQRSIYTGYMNARGVAAVQLDGDLQDPPELIPRFVQAWEEGNEVVYGVRRSRKESWLMHFVRRSFYRVIDFMSEYPLPHDAGDFRLVDRRVIEEMRRVEDQQPYLRGLITTLGFEQVGIAYDRDERKRGTSKFTFRELVRFALDGILNHSTVPLRLATYTGLTISILTFLGSIGYLVGRFLLGRDWPPGFATTTILILMTLSLTSLFLGIIGEYLGRIYHQVKRRPIAVIDREVDADAVMATRIPITRR